MTLAARMRSWRRPLLEFACYYLLAYVVIVTAPADLTGWGLIAYAVVVALLTVRLGRLIARAGAR